MSQAKSPRETYRCAECGGDRDAYQSIKGSFCSWDCFYRRKGRNALRKIKHDHRWCASCFRPVKCIEAPPEGKSVTCGPVDHDQHEAVGGNLLIGYQYPTEFMERAVDEFRAAYADNWRTDGDAPADRVERTRWSCQCGAVDTGHRYLELEDVDPVLILTSAARCLSQLASDETIGGTFDRERYKHAIADHYLVTGTTGVYGTDWVGWETAVGQTLYGPPTSDD